MPAAGCTDTKIDLRNPRNLRLIPGVRPQLPVRPSISLR